MYDFFLAYATPDRQQAQNLCWFLQDGACKVFLDVQDFKPGASWPPALRKAIEASRAIVVLVSTHTDDAFYQQEEIIRAIQLARDTPQAHTVIPVILDELPHGAVRMPYGLSSLQMQDATRPGGLRRVAAELVVWLREQQLHLASLVDKTAARGRGVAALAIRSGDLLPSLVQVSVRSEPGPTIIGATGDGEVLRQRLTRDAAVWVRQYVRRFRGEIRRSFDGNSSFPVCSLPDGHYDSLDQIRTAILIAYLARILHDALCYDLSLPVEFPESLMVCAAGAGEEGGKVIGLTGWLDTIHRERWSGPTTIWYAADRSRNWSEMPPLPPSVKLIAVDHMDQIAQSLLEEFESFLPQSSVPTTIANSLRQGVDELYTLEKLLEEAAQEALGKKVRIERLEGEIAIRERQLKWLDETALQVREDLRKHRPVPQLSDFLDQFTRLEPELHRTSGSEPDRGVLVIPSGFEKESEQCLHLYRRLARIYHPDRQPVEAEMFLQLVAHRWDLTWLEALDGATEPLRVEALADDIEKRIDALMDRLYLLNDVRKRFDRKIAAKEQELQSQGGRIALALDEDLESRQTVLSILQMDIDRVWRTLNYMAGWEQAPEVPYEQA